MSGPDGSSIKQTVSCATGKLHRSNLHVYVSVEHVKVFRRSTLKLTTVFRDTRGYKMTFEQLVQEFVVFGIPTLLRLFVAALLGGCFGFIREKKRKPAGLKTHIMVSTAAALVMIIGDYLAKTTATGTDVARLGAQVISGVGFLGAGTIMKSKASIKGITTAASIWAVACVGLACGAGFYVGAIIATIFIIGTTFIANAMERRMHSRDAQPEPEPFNDYYEIVDED